MTIDRFFSSLFILSQNIFSQACRSFLLTANYKQVAIRWFFLTADDKKIANCLGFSCQFANISVLFKNHAWILK